MNLVTNCDWSKLSNTELEKELYYEENIEILENIINRTIKEYDNIPRTKYCKDIRLSKEQLKQELQNINKEVSKFLDIENSSLPSIRYRDIYSSFKYEIFPLLTLFAGSSLFGLTALLYLKNAPNISTIFTGTFGMYYFKELNDYRINFKNIRSSYYHNNNLMLICKEDRKEIISDIAHEQTHHVQKKLKWPLENDDYKILIEGHARGVERHVARIYAERENDKRIIKSILPGTLLEYVGIYMKMCERMKKKINIKLLKNHNTEYRPGMHAVGNTLFSIAEEKFGPKVYAGALRGVFAF